MADQHNEDGHDVKRKQISIIFTF